MLLVKRGCYEQNILLSRQELVYKKTPSTLEHKL